jgi:hypothetical protein
MQAISETVRFVIPADRLLKAVTHKYIRRWRGKHGEWQYEYASEAQEAEHAVYLAEKERKESRRERAAAVTDRYSEDDAAERLAELGGQLYATQAMSETGRGGYAKDDAGLSLMDMKAWENTEFLTGKAQTERRRQILAKYIRQIGDEGEHFSEYVKLGLWDTLTRQKEEKAGAAGQPKHFIEPSRNRYGGMNLPITGYMKGDLFNKQKEVMQKYKEHGLRWDGGDRVWYVPAPKVREFPFADMAKDFGEIGISMDVPELPAAAEGKKHAPSDEPTGTEGLSPDAVIEAIKRRRVDDTAVVSVIQEGEYKGKYAFYSTYSKEWNTIFDNKEGPLTGITEYSRELGHARITSDRHLVDEALEHIRKRMPNHTVIVDPRVEQKKQAEVEALAENQKPIPEVQKHLAQGVNLFPFQNEGTRFLIEKGGNALIGDEMGLGKTLQTLAYGAATGKRMLVVCPKVVRKNWLREGTRFFPDYFRGRELRAKDLKQGQPDLSGDNLVTVNYESLQKFLPAIEAAGFDAIVIDESHRMKEPKAKITKLLKALAPKMKHRILLSGTAIKNKKVELFEQLELIRPGMFGTRDQLKMAFTGRVFHKLQEVYLARRKLDVLDGLPPKISSIVRAEVKDPSLLPATPRQIGEMSAAKQQLALAKVPGTAAFVKEMLQSSDSNMLVFTDSKEAANLLKEELGAVAALHTGDTPDKAREEAVGHFDPQTRKPGDPVRVFVATTQSAGVGINLQTADKVVFNDLPWTPADLRQAEDRAWRIGTKTNVNVYWQTVDGHEFDELIADTIKKKYEIYKKTLEGKKLTEQERAWMDSKVTKEQLLGGLQGKRVTELEAPPPGEGPAPDPHKTQSEPMVESPESRVKTQPVGVGVDSPPLAPKEKLPAEQPAAVSAEAKSAAMDAIGERMAKIRERERMLGDSLDKKGGLDLKFNVQQIRSGYREVLEHAKMAGDAATEARAREKISIAENVLDYLQGKGPLRKVHADEKIRRQHVRNAIRDLIDRKLEPITEAAPKPPKMVIREPAAGPAAEAEKPPPPKMTIQEPAGDHVDSNAVPSYLRNMMDTLHRYESEGKEARTPFVQRGNADKMEIWLRANVGRTVEGGKVEAVGENAWRWRGGGEEITLKRDPKDPMSSELTYSSKAPDPTPGGEPPAGDAMADHAARVEAYNAKLEAKRDRLRERADKARAESAARFKASDMSEEATGIPMGQPILVGHHSEARHRKTLERAHANMGRAIAAKEKAEHLERRAEAVGHVGISSDDPEATSKLHAELQRKIEARDTMKKLNAAWRKHGEDWAAIQEATGVNDKTMDSLKTAIARLPHYEKQPFPGYALTNIGAEIRRIQGRIKDLEVSAIAPVAAPIVGAGYRIEEHPADNRIRFYFDEKPPRETTQAMRRAGFKWSPTEGAWQRHLNEAGKYHAKRMAKELFGEGPGQEAHAPAEPVETPAPPPPEVPPEVPAAAVPAPEEGPQTAVEPKPKGKPPAKAKAVPGPRTRAPKRAQRRGPQIEQMSLFKSRRISGADWLEDRVYQLLKSENVHGAAELLWDVGRRYLQRRERSGLNLRFVLPV